MITDALPKRFATYILPHCAAPLRACIRNDFSEVHLVVWPERNNRVESALFLRQRGARIPLEIALPPYFRNRMERHITTLLRYDMTKAFHRRQQEYGVAFLADGRPIGGKCK